MEVRIGRIEGVGFRVWGLGCTWTPKYVEYWPFGLYLEDLGHYFTYFGGLGRA